MLWLVYREPVIFMIAISRRLVVAMFLTVSFNVRQVKMLLVEVVSVLMDPFKNRRLRVTFGNAGLTAIIMCLLRLFVVKVR